MIEKERRAELRTFLASLAIAAVLVIPAVLVLQKINEDAAPASSRPAVSASRRSAPLEVPAHDPIVIVTWYLEATPTRYVGPLSTQRERMMSCLRRHKLCTIEMRGG